MLQFKRSRLYGNLTIVMVCRNWASLHYPFVEAIWSTIPLGCEYLIGDFGDDESAKILAEMSKYAPITVVKGTWNYKAKLGAIGLATNDVWKQATTAARYNLQGNEVLTDGGPEKFFEWFDKFGYPTPDTIHGGISFKHFWGSPFHEGKAAYKMARRLGNKEDNYIRGSGDGCYPSPHQTSRIGALVHRYSYCFDNQIEAKIDNHTKLWGKRNPAEWKRKVRSRRKSPNYDGPHPSCVQHVINRLNYDLKHSMDTFRQHIEPMGGQ